MKPDEEMDTVVQTLQSLNKKGFVRNFQLKDNRLIDVDSEQKFDASDLTILEVHRFEGMTDPADMSVIYAIQTNKGTRGCLVLNYSASYSNNEEFLKKIPIKREVIGK